MATWDDVKCYLENVWAPWSPPGEEACYRCKLCGNYLPLNEEIAIAHIVEGHPEAALCTEGVPPTAPAPTCLLSFLVPIPVFLEFVRIFIRPFLPLWIRSLYYFLSKLLIFE